MNTLTPDRNEARWLERLEWNRSRLADLTRLVDGASGAEEPAAELAGQAQELELRLAKDEMLRVLAENQEQVERALDRLREGRYGLCEGCGAAIPAERLRFRPEATRCVRCQQRYESLGPVRAGDSRGSLQ